MPSPESLTEADAALQRIMVHLDPSERGLVQQTEFVIADSPTAEQLEGFPKDGFLLGLYESPPPRVTVFEQEAARANAAGVDGSTVSKIVLHEVGHVVGYTHAMPGVEDRGQAGMQARCGWLPPGDSKQGCYRMDL